MTATAAFTNATATRPRDGGGTDCLHSKHPPMLALQAWVFVYDLPHFILARQAGGRELKVLHLDGRPFTVHICDTEPVP